MNKVHIFLALMITMTSCAYIDQNLKVAPSAQVAMSDIGQGKPVFLRVVDDREDQLIGKRVDGYGFSGAKISTDQDLAQILEQMVSMGLERKGFTLTSDGSSPTKLKAELRSLNYDTARGIWTGGNIGKTVIKVTAQNDSGYTYERSYRSQKEIRSFFIGSQETNAKVVNEAFTEAIQKIFEDRELLTFLTQ